MFICCTQKSYKHVTQLIWFIVSAIGHPFVFLLTLPFPKNMLSYEIPNQNLMMLHALPFILLALSAKTIWYLFLITIAYLRGNNIYKFLDAQLLPQTTWSLLGQLLFLSLGYTNLYKMTISGMDTTIVGMLFFILIGIASFITVITGNITIYKILRKRYA